MNPARLHLVCLPHVRLGTSTTHLCAYSGKVMKFIKMMKGDYEIFVYAPESDPIEGVMMVDCLSENLRIAIFGKDDDNRLPNWPTDAQSSLFNAQVVEKMRERIQERDLILLVGGWTNKPVSDAFPNHIKCEPFCGYQGIIATGNVTASGPHVAFESYFHMAQVYQKYGINDIRWYDRVIPPFVDPDEFPKVNDGKGEYLLFLGRLIQRKGPHIALQIAEACNLPLMIAGAGGQWDGKTLVGNGVTLSSNKVEICYKGPVGIEQRAELMAGAKAFLCPTTYFEPGGNVAIEAMMAGTPVICPDSGVFAETVPITFHFRTLAEARDNIECNCWVPSHLRVHAVERYSLAAIRLKYMQWFNDMLNLWGEGWSAL